MRPAFVRPKAGPTILTLGPMAAPLKTKKIKPITFVLIVTSLYIINLVNCYQTMKCFRYGIYMLSSKYGSSTPYWKKKAYRLLKAGQASLTSQYGLNKTIPDRHWQKTVRWEISLARATQSVNKRVFVHVTGQFNLSVRYE